MFENVNVKSTIALEVAQIRRRLALVALILYPSSIWYQQMHVTSELYFYASLPSWMEGWVCAIEERKRVGGVYRQWPWNRKQNTKIPRLPPLAYNISWPLVLSISLIWASFVAKRALRISPRLVNTKRINAKVDFCNKWARLLLYIWHLTGQEAGMPYCTTCMSGMTLNKTCPQPFAHSERKFAWR